MPLHANCGQGTGRPPACDVRSMVLLENCVPGALVVRPRGVPVPRVAPCGPCKSLGQAV